MSYQKEEILYKYQQIFTKIIAKLFLIQFETIENLSNFIQKRFFEIIQNMSRKIVISCYQPYENHHGWRYFINI